jgi:hypothetical protein
MKSVVYVSTVRHPFDSVDLEQLVEEAARRNAKDGITGLLAYNGESFMQLLEGKAEAVEERLDVIRGDSRHECMVIIRKQAIEKRECEAWSMTARTVPLCEEGSAAKLFRDWPETFSNETRMLFTSFSSMLQPQMA